MSTQAILRNQKRNKDLKILFLVMQSFSITYCVEQLKFEEPFFMGPGISFQFYIIGLTGNVICGEKRGFCEDACMITGSQ